MFCWCLLVQVVPGETALAFFTAKNPTKKHITGVATYNVFPLKAGKCPLLPIPLSSLLSWMWKWELRSTGHHSVVGCAMIGVPGRPP